MSDDVIEYVAWPIDLRQAISCKLIRTTTGGRSRLVSSDGCAWVELGSHRQTLTTCYLASHSQERDISRGTEEPGGEGMALSGQSDTEEEKVCNVSS